MKERSRLALVLAVVGALPACGSDATDTPGGAGSAMLGGTSGVGTTGGGAGVGGGATAAGGSSGSSGSAGKGVSGGTGVAGMPAGAGGGGAGVGGAMALGGQSGSSGAATGGGGAAGNPNATGGMPSSSGGMPSAGASGSAGAGAGGGAGGAGKAGAAGAAGAAACDWSDPPTNVAAWVDESWAAQLGNNVKTRKAWNLDNVMLNGGSMNLCVRWGATSAVPDSVKMNLAGTIERWFNDWFKGLGSYGCFPYGAGISVKITGWAVKAGQEALLSGITGVPIYNETDGDGEPKCPDACSSFVHWDHDFSGCTGGDASHSDYWLWFDDALPGGGGAAAVGGDWGLRMPVSTFVQAFDRTSFNIVEHEMGHGFGIQDYYDWTGLTPSGGSIMIVGSSSSQAPTTGDIWLLRRTWKEMKTLRGW